MKKNDNYLFQIILNCDLELFKVRFNNTKVLTFQNFCRNHAEKKTVGLFAIIIVLQSTDVTCFVYFFFLFVYYCNDKLRPMKSVSQTVVLNNILVQIHPFFFFFLYIISFAPNVSMYIMPINPNSSVFTFELKLFIDQSSNAYTQ